MNITEKFNVLFNELDHCTEIEQKQKIEEIREIMDEMDEDEIESIFTINNLNKIGKMIEEKNMTLDRAILLSKHIGYCKALTGAWSDHYYDSELSKRFEKMIVEEDEKKEEKNERLLVDLCECHLITSKCFIPDNVIVICMLHLLKAASNKKENEETQKEVEMALVASSNIWYWVEIKQERYINEIKEIIEYHQKRHNLSRFAYQSAWDFLINRFNFDKRLGGMIMNELHFVREAVKELEDLTRCVDWKKKKEEMSREEAKEANVVKRWIRTLKSFFEACNLWNKELAGLVSSVVNVFRVAKDSHREICRRCIHSLKEAAISKSVKIEDLLKSRSMDVVFEELHQPTLSDEINLYCFRFFEGPSRKLEESTDDEIDEAKRKRLKRNVFEKMENEGFEDVIISFEEIFSFLVYKFECTIPGYSTDYFVNV